MSGVSGPKSAEKSLNAVQGAQQSHVQSWRSHQEDLQRRFAPPVAVNPKLVEQQTRNALNNGGSTVPQSLFSVGHFIPHDPKDTEMDTLASVINPNTGATNWGLAMANTSEIVNYATKKADSQAYLDQLRTAEYLVDPKDPRTIKKLYELFPELEKVPEAWYTDYQTLQWTLRDLLQYGEINSREHHILVMFICSPGFQIPIYPAWDPLGALIEQTATAQEFRTWKSVTRKGLQKSRFNPFQYASDGVVGDQITDDQRQQKEIKALIIRRLYPGCRDMTNDEIERFVIAKIQDIDGTYRGINTNFQPGKLLENGANPDFDHGLGVTHYGRNAPLRRNAMVIENQ